MKKRVLPLMIILSIIITMLPSVALAAKPEAVTTFAQLRTALQRANVENETPDNPSLIKVMGNLEGDANGAVITVTGHKTLISDGKKTISRGSMDRTLINVKAGTLNIGVPGDNDNVLTFDGGTQPSREIYSGIVSASSGATFNIYTGVFCNNSKMGTTNANAGSTIDADNATVNIYGATIKDNTKRGTNGSHGGGGLYVRNGATVTIDGATITGNKSEVSGGGIYVAGSLENPSTLIFKSGTITGNTATNSSGTNRLVAKGSAIHLGNYSIFEMYGGTIGGAIDDGISAGGNDSSLIEMSATSTAAIYGGTIIGDAKIRRIISSAGSLELTARQGGLGATIKNGGNNNNNDNQEAAAVYLWGSAVFTINAGVIKDFNGRAIATASTANAVVNLYGGKIKGCENPVVKNNGASNSSVNMGGDFWMTGNLAMGKAGNTININSDLTNKSAVIATFTGSSSAPLANNTTVLSGLVADNARKFAGIAASGSARLGVNPENGKLSSLPEFAPPKPEDILEYVKILGNVVDEEGEPVEYAEIWVDEELLCETDEQGYFTAAMPISAVERELVINADGFMELGPVGFTPDDDKGLGEFQLMDDEGEKVRISGTVADKDGAPVAAAEIWIKNRRAAVSGNDGTFTIVVRKSDIESELVIKKDGYNDSAVIRFTPDDDKDLGKLELVKIKPAVLSGIITGEDGEPVADAEILIDGTMFGATGADGKFAIELPKSDTKRSLTVKKYGYYDFGPETFIPGDDIDFGVIELRKIKPATITGTVVDGYGVPVENAEIRIDGMNFGPTGLNGSFSIEVPLGDSEISLVVKKLQYNDSNTFRFIPDGDKNLGSIVLVKIEYVNISGAVTNDGIPVEGAEIWVNGAKHGVTDTNGQFTVKVIKSSSGSILSVRKAGYAYANVPFLPDTHKDLGVIAIVAINTSIVINEVCSQNKSGIRDSKNRHSDWVEFYNSTDSPIILDGYGFSDNPNKPEKWIFPENSIILPKEYIIVFASGDGTVYDTPAGREIHTNFSIAQDGETLTLTDKNGNMVSILDVPFLVTDITYGRYPDASETLKRMHPTPGASNDNAVTLHDILDPPVFSHESGFYPDEFDLTISAPEGMTVYYTTDGSDPAASPASTVCRSDRFDADMYTKTTQKYDGAPIRIVNPSVNDNIYSMINHISVYGTERNKYPRVKIDKVMIIRAIACDNEGNMSNIITKSYFVGHSPANYNNVPVISLVTDPDNLFDDEKGIYVLGSRWNGSQVDFSTPTNYNMSGREWERPAHMDFFESDGSLAFSQGVGIRTKGNYSKVFAQKSFNVYARSEYGAKTFEHKLFGDDCVVSASDPAVIDSFERFALRSGGNWTWEYKYWDAFLQNRMRYRETLLTERNRLSVVFIDGEFWGTYYIQESMSAEFIGQHTGLDPDDLIIVKGGGLDNGTADDKRDFYDPAVAIAGMPMVNHADADNNYKKFTEAWDVENFADYYALMCYVQNIDIGGNIIIWRSRTTGGDNPYHDGKWRFAVHDLDKCMEYPNDGSASLMPSLFSNHSLVKQIRYRPEFIEEFVTALMDYANVNYEPVSLTAESNKWVNELLPLVDINTRRWNANYYQQYLINKNNTQMNKFVVKQEVFPAKIKEFFELPGDLAEVTLNADPEMGGIKLNRTTADLSSGTWKGKYFTDFPVTVTAVPKEGYVFKEWQVSDGSSVDDANKATGAKVTLASSGTTVTALYEEAGPIEISNAYQLIEASQNVNRGIDVDRAYVLVNDIDLSGVENFTPIGNVNYPFNGVFDGRHHTITGINIENKTQGQGLFGYSGTDAVIKNIAMLDVNIKGDKNVGAIAGNNRGLIEYCYSTGTLNGESTVGGITGNNKGGRIRFCFSTANINCASDNTKSGIAGKVEGTATVSHCYSLITPVSKDENGLGIIVNTSIKSAAEFEDGTVAALLNTEKILWKNGDSHPIFLTQEAAPVIAVTYDGSSVSISSDMAIDSAVFVLASYDNALLVDIRLFTVDIAPNVLWVQPVTGFSQGDKVKVMLWNSLVKLKPFDNVVVNMPK